MRFFAYIFIFAGVIFLADAVFDQYRGIASVRSPSRASALHVASRAEQPDEFRNLMAYQWMRGSLALFAGIIIFGICRRADHLDPTSPNFGSSHAHDDANQKLTEKQNKRPRPVN